MITTYPCPPWIGPVRTWVPLKSALKLESWDWNKGDEKNREAIGPGRRMRKGNGHAKRHSKRDVEDWRSEGREGMGNLEGSGRN